MNNQSPSEERAREVLAAVCRKHNMHNRARNLIENGPDGPIDDIALAAMLEFASQAAQPAEADGCEIEKIEVAFNAWNDGDISKGYSDRYSGFIAGYRSAAPKAPATDAGEVLRIEAAAHALHELEDSWNDVAWQYLPEGTRKLFRAQATVAVSAALATPPAPNDDLRAEAECARLLAAYLRKEIGRLMHQAEHWAENGKPLAVHHRLMKADDYFQILVLMERDPAKGWKLPFDEIRADLERPDIHPPGAYPPSADLYRYRDPAFVAAALKENRRG